MAQWVGHQYSQALCTRSTPTIYLYCFHFKNAFELSWIVSFLLSKSMIASEFQSVLYEIKTESCKYFFLLLLFLILLLLFFLIFLLILSLLFLFL